MTPKDTNGAATLLGSFVGPLHLEPIPPFTAILLRASYSVPANFGMTSFAIISIEARIFFCSSVAKFIMKIM